MRNIAILSAAAAAAVAFSGVAHANHHEKKDGAKMEAHAEQHEMKEGAHMDADMKAKADMDSKMGAKMDARMDAKAKVMTSTRGRAQTVMLNGKEYQVCGGTVTDNCINPREAGLNFGNRALDYWPGKPASEM